MDTTSTRTQTAIQQSVTKASLMKAHCSCAVSSGCSDSKRPTARTADGNSHVPFARRCLDLVGSLLPSAIMAVLPKCPVCLAAYVRDWNWSWNFGVNGDIAEVATCASLVGVAVMLCVNTGAALHGVDVQNGRNSSVKAMRP